MSSNAAKQRSAGWHARERAYHEWVEINRNLIEHLMSDPNVPEDLRPRGELPPPRPRRVSVSANRPDAVSGRGGLHRPDELARPDASMAIRPDDLARPAGGFDLNGHLTPSSNGPAGRPAEGGGRGRETSSRLNSELTGYVSPPTPPQPAGRIDDGDRADGDDRVAAVAALVRSVGAPVVLTASDKRAIRNCAVEPSLIAEAYSAAARGDWGSEWLRQNLQLRMVISRISGFLVWKARPHAETPRNGYRPTHNPQHI